MRLSELGLNVPDEEIPHLFSIFKELADRKKEMTDDDLVAIVLDERLSKDQDHFYELKSVQIQNNSDQVHTATVTLSGRDNEFIEESSTGAGSVEALYNTLERCVKEHVHLLDYRIQSVGAGRDALAQVFVNLNYAGKESSGRGLAQDVIEASAKAY